MARQTAPRCVGQGGQRHPRTRGCRCGEGWDGGGEISAVLTPTFPPPRSSTVTVTTTHIRRTCSTCPSMPASSASCPWPGTTASPCVWSCWAATSRRLGRKDGAALPHRPALALPAPAHSCSDLTPLSSCPQTWEAARRAPLPRVGAGAAALHFMGPLQVGCGDGSCPLIPLVRDETPSCNQSLAGGPSPATGASLGDPILQMGLCWGTLSCNQGLAASSQLSLETNFLPLFCFCFQQRGYSQQQFPACTGARDSAVLGS